MSEKAKIEVLQKRLLEWVEEGNLREFPWRNTSSPFEVLVAEILLQQTPANRVEQVYRELLAEYPTLEALAEAEADDVASLIEELGLHNKRGKALVRNARDLEGDEIPTDLDSLTDLSYVNDYGANAVLCFAFEEDRPIVDANVQRIYNRFFGNNYEVEDSGIWDLAERTLPNERIQEFNLALLDFGNSICQSSPNCSDCFLNDQCRYYNEVHSG